MSILDYAQDFPLLALMGHSIEDPYAHWNSLQKSVDDAWETWVYLQVTKDMGIGLEDHSYVKSQEFCCTCEHCKENVRGAYFEYCDLHKHILEASFDTICLDWE